MRRDMDLVRQLLLRIEAVDLNGAADLDIDGYNEQAIDYNLDLLIQAGLVNGSGQWSLGGTYHVSIRGLTWSGHDFLDAVRADSIWHKAKQMAQDKGLGLHELPLDVVKQLGVTVLKNVLELTVG